jgi:hypothetical protein
MIQTDDNFIEQKDVLASFRHSSARFRRATDSKYWLLQVEKYVAQRALRPAPLATGTALPASG